MGITGAAVATAIGWCIPALAGVAYFLFSQNPLRFARPKLDWRTLGESCFNGSSEMVTNISTGVTTFLFNILMLRYLGEDGVAAITIVLYAQFLLTALYLGFSMGVAPGRQLQLRKREHPPAQAALQDLRPVHRRLVGGRLRGFAAAGGAPCGGLFPARHGGL